VTQRGVSQRMALATFPLREVPGQENTTGGRHNIEKINFREKSLRGDARVNLLATTTTGFPVSISLRLQLCLTVSTFASAS
jgi:hypothetical protein